jgi:hypothetical protein
VSIVVDTDSPITQRKKKGSMILDPCDSLVVNQSVTSALAAEALMAPVKRIGVDAAQALAAAVAELRRPLSAAVARRHCLVERSETASLNLFTRLDLRVLMSAVLMGWTAESGWMMCLTLMSARPSVRIGLLRTSMMLWVGVRVAFGLRLRFHVDSSRKNSRPVIVYF